MRLLIDESAFSYIPTSRSSRHFSQTDTAVHELLTDHMHITGDSQLDQAW